MILLGAGILIKTAIVMLSAGGAALGGDCMHSWSKKELRRLKKEEKENKKK